METTRDQSADGPYANLGKPVSRPSLNVLWICLVAWAVSFFLPVARYQDWGGEKTMFGWEAAYTALVLFFLPVKGMWLGFEPHVWSVFANFFMLWAPFQCKRLEKTHGRNFAVAFSVTALAVVALLFIPESADLASIREFEAGFVLWALSIVGASAWFSSVAWGNVIALLPNIVSAVALLCGLFIWSPYLQGRQHRAERDREQAASAARMRQQQETQNAAVWNAIAQRGLVAFTEPMTGIEESNLEYYLLSAHKFDPAELTAASDHYHNPKIMDALALNPACPPEALEILYRHAAEKEKGSASDKATALRHYLNIASNPNTGTDLLLTMLRSGDPGQRAAALRSRKLPSQQKMDYLQNACALTDDSEMMTAAEDADTPVEVLECLSAKPGAAIGLAANPHTPTSALERMSQSTDWRIANEAKIALAQRKRVGK